MSKERIVKYKPARVIFNPTGKKIIEPMAMGPDNLPIVRSGLYAHFCYDWDEMLIDEHDPEFEYCICGMPNNKT